MFELVKAERARPRSGLCAIGIPRFVVLASSKDVPVCASPGPAWPGAIDAINPLK